MAHLVIGTRSDMLAVRQASFVKTQIEQKHVGLQVALEILADDETSSNQSGDWLDEASLALQARRVDALVHHLCDLSPCLPEDVHLAAVVERTDARDALLISPALRQSIHTLADLPAQARVIAHGGHRRVQIAAQQPHVLFVGDACSLESALRKLAANEIEALVADACSLLLLQAQDLITAWLELTEFIPAAGQGVLTLQSRLEDQRTNLILESLNHQATRHAVNAERATLRNLYGEPGDAIAVTARLVTDGRTPQLAVCGLAGDASLAKPIQIIRGQLSGDPNSPEMIGGILALQLLNDGARTLLNQPRVAQALAEQTNELAQLYPISFAQLDDEPKWEEDITALRPMRPPMHPKTHAASAFQGADSNAALVDVSSSAAMQPRSRDIAAFTDDAFPEFDLVASKVQRLRQHLPLQDQRILLAYAGKKYDGLASSLEALGATVFTLPKLRTAAPSSWEALDKVLVHISWYDWLVFANAASVTACLERSAALGHGVAELEARRLCVIGQATATSLKSAGLLPDLVLPQFNADTLSAEWEKHFGQRGALRGKTMLWLTSETAAHEFTHTSRLPLRAGFDQLGVYVEAVPAYRYAASQELAKNMTFDYALFFDSASFDSLATQCAPQPPAESLNTTRLVCFSEAAQESARSLGFAAPLHVTESTLSGIVEWLRENALSQLTVKAGKA